MQDLMKDIAEKAGRKPNIETETNSIPRLTVEDLREQCKAATSNTAKSNALKELSQAEMALQRLKTQVSCPSYHGKGPRPVWAVETITEAEIQNDLKNDAEAERDCLGHTPNQAKAFDQMCQEHDEAIEKAQATPRRLQATWGFEAAQDAKLHHGVDLEAEIMAAMDGTDIKSRIKYARRRIDLEDALSETLSALLGCRALVGDMIEHLALCDNVQSAIDKATKLLHPQPESRIEDFGGPNPTHGRGSKVETLPGTNLGGTTDDLRYFNSRMITGLGVPKEHLHSDYEPEANPTDVIENPDFQVDFVKTYPGRHLITFMAKRAE